MARDPQVSTVCRVIIVPFPIRLDILPALADPHHDTHLVLFVKSRMAWHSPWRPRGWFS
jgi:hypothetical protein